VAIFFFNLWDQLSESEFADVVTQSAVALFPQDAPRFLVPRTLHGTALHFTIPIAL
jgi:hypothetical protein